MNDRRHHQTIDVLEHGAARDGAPQTLDRRLFMQLLVFDCSAAREPAQVLVALGKALQQGRIPAVIYEDLNNPTGIGLLSWSEDAADFTGKLRASLGDAELTGLRLRPEFTMTGRSYSSGFEPDLEYWLLHRPRERVLDEAFPWAVWYPLRRTGAFQGLESSEQAKILREHADIGRAYGAAGFAHDVRLACHGLNAADCEFLIGLVGETLHPLSHLVEAMRKTRQTAEFISQMGPFFVGHAAFRNPG
jgi:hypothetical protein